MDQNVTESRAVTSDDYAKVARELADALMVWARDRRTEDSKAIGWLQHELCQLRRKETGAKPGALT